MKFVTFLKDGREKLGIYNEFMTQVININSLKLSRKYCNMNDLIKNIDDIDLEILQQACFQHEDSSYEVYSINDIKICAPITKSENDIICLGLNYVEHVNETSRSFKDDSIDIPKYPVYFSKRVNKIIGSKEKINSYKGLVEELDYEVELAVVIGKDGINIPKEKVEEYIFGYTIMNDISARDLQHRHIQWYRGKSLDTFTSLGPCIVHKSEIKFPIELNLRSKVNGELRQNSNTKHFIFNIPTIIHDLSLGMTLKAGDIIATGTPEGVGMGFDQPKFLKKGDIVECEIEGIGVLKNKVI
jgi:2-keto-4-pentenoate hydratase/2-oxohepta-3-ene-1,7-dioic acid hydratase in catechol pathway